MNVSFVESGYAGATVAACLADCGHQVGSVDGDGAVIEDINAVVTPIYGPD